MQRLEAFLPRIMIHVDGCPRPLAEQALVDSAIRFCVETDVVQVKLDPMDLVKDEQRYELDIPRDTQLARVQRIVYGEDPLNPFLAPTRYEWETPATVILFPKPTETKEAWVHVEVSTKPKRTARTLDDTLLEVWVEAVCGGAVAQIAAMQGQVFTDPNKVTIGLGQYMAGVNRAKYELRKQHSTQDLRVVPRPAVRRRNIV